jgi:hypothetical protein
MQPREMPMLTAKSYVMVRVSNIGDKTTTITNILLFYYNSWWARLRQRPTSNLFIPRHGLHPLPHVLDPGNVWDALIKEDAAIETMAKNGWLYVSILHSGSKKPTRRRLEFK